MKRPLQPVQAAGSGKPLDGLDRASLAPYCQGQAGRSRCRVEQHHAGAALTAIAFSGPTAAVETQAKTDTALQAKLAADTKLFARAGGLPVMAGGKMIGAIGVGGAPGGDKDEACAKAGLAKIADRLK